MKKRLGIGLGVLMALFIGGSLVYGQEIKTYFEVKQITDTFFEHVTKQEFEQAFDAIGYYNEASDMEPTISRDDAKAMWMKRMKDAYAEGTFVLKVFDVNISFNDTYPSANGIMQYNDQGEWNDRVVLISYIYQDGWKIGRVGFADEDGPEEHPLSTAMSGYMPE
ncbi:hypothetical protein ACFO0S_14590 [Chryseomicrobium palamuruense]|uniref:DUF4829 domain-containing protein n=1 Tax=Chryseomicrobium palamuruense TaxID=682973 RepID=A0ABV8UY93_9BACL